MIAGLKQRPSHVQVTFLPRYMSYDSMILLIVLYVTVYIIFYALHTRYTIRTDVPSCGRCVSCRAGQQTGGRDP